MLPVAAASPPNLFDPQSLLPFLGPWALLGIAVIVFIESGLLFPFLPGDSLLVTAALLSSPLGLSPWLITAVAVVAAVAGDQVGYVIGRRFGRRLFSPDARVLKTARLEETERFFQRYGPAALVLGRFIPIVRTYVPLAAGAAELPYPRFIRWNVLGALLWVCGLVAVGFFLGGIPFVARNVDVLMIVVVLVSLAPIGVNLLLRAVRARRERQRARLGGMRSRALQARRPRLR